MSDQLYVTTYAIDVNDQLIEVDEAWTAFAEENEAGHSLRPESVIGTSLWNYIREPSLVRIYRRLIKLSRERTEPIQFEFRCDSPAFRRYMLMQMKSRSGGGVTFVSRMIRLEKRDDNMRTMAAFAARTLVRQCSVCNRFQCGDHWGEVDELVANTRAMNQDGDASVIWTVCGDCRSRLATVGASGD